MSYRHHFIAGSIIAPPISKHYWEYIGEINFSATGTYKSKKNNFHGLDNTGNILFSCNLPLNSQLISMHNTEPELVIKSKDKPEKLNILDYETQTLVTELRCRTTRTFTGNAIYSKDGTKLFTLEINKRSGKGFLTCWDRRLDYTKLDEYSSGGLNPTQILRLPESDILAVANAGKLDIKSRSKVTTPVPKLSNLTFISEEGDNLETMILEDKYRSNSICSINVRADGLIVFAAQETNGPDYYSTLIGVHRIGDITTIVSSTLKENLNKIKKIIFMPNTTEIALITDRSNQIEIYSILDGHQKSLKVSNVHDIASDRSVTIAATNNGKLHFISKFDKMVTQPQHLL